MRDDLVGHEVLLQRLSRDRLGLPRSICVHKLLGRIVMLRLWVVVHDLCVAWGRDEVWWTPGSNVSYLKGRKGSFKSTHLSFYFLCTDIGMETYKSSRNFRDVFQKSSII